ncbi:MAG: hypothetical protein M4579_001214 [Chaenotheca gracillima]|nr:MAG: hypothetical protein M4579_001214 [Chaenotheca gracillima]
MQRAAIQAFRTATRPNVRSLLSRRGSPSEVLALRSASSNSERVASGGPVPPPSMFFRNFSVAVISALATSGAWYAYQGSTTSSKSGAIPDIPSDSINSQSVVEGNRRAVVVENGQFYTGTFAGEGPVGKLSDDAGRKVVEMMTTDQATQKLRRNEESYLVGRGRGVVRYDVSQLPSNDPIEDDHIEKIVDVPQSVAASQGGAPNSDWMFFGVFDGHSGWTTSAKLRQVLVNFVARELNATYKSALADPAVSLPSPEAIDTAIKKGFVLLDHEIVHGSVEKVMNANSKRVAAELLAPALSGACALLSFYDSRSKDLRVACTGDSRAVLGQRGESGKWVATALSADQTAYNEDEVRRMRAEHPGEPDVLRNGRVLGRLEPLRAFGDSSFKWTREVATKINNSFFGRAVPQQLKTPPYVTAEPVVTTTKVNPERGDFVVLATDGLWEMLTNEEAVGLVGQWLDVQRDDKASQGKTSDSWLKSWFGTSSKSLPVEQTGGAGVDAAGTHRAPAARREMLGLSANADARFTVEDKNVATHLIRNALGGKDQEIVCALLTLPYPTSRRYRDDLTVQVIFFGEDQNANGNVIRNLEASAQGGDIKAKL